MSELVQLFLKEECGVSSSAFGGFTPENVNKIVSLGFPASKETVTPIEIEEDNNE